MGMSEVVMVVMMGRMMVLDMDLGTQMAPGLGVCRWTPSHLQHFVHEAGIQTGDLFGWSC